MADEAALRLTAFTEAVLAYRAAPIRRERQPGEPVWQSNGVALRRYPGSGPPVVLVPSLINRADVLDLDDGASFVAALGAIGFSPLVLDWGDPARDWPDATLDDLLLLALAPALAATGHRPAIIGYCMGGTLAAALAALRPEMVSALAVLAAPWSFHAEGAERATLLAQMAGQATPIIDAAGGLPVDAIQSLFASLDPTLVPRKFRAAASLDREGAAWRRFVLVEDWLNDGLTLPPAIARTVLADWYGADTPGRGAWRVAGETVDPARVTVPALVVVPRADRIVPPASALALADRLPQAEVMRVGTGHVGLMVGASAPTRVWPDLFAWLRRATTGLSD